MKKLLTIAACTALTGGLLAGCGSSKKSSSSSGSTTIPAASTGGSAAGGQVSVTMKDIQFKPQEVKAKVGQTITWKNDDPVAHTVTAKSGADFDSGTVNSGGSFTFTVKKAGTIQYVCTIHPNQTGTIVVS